tara:strand:- start:525 stop:716 length:192 start_codon:yes stop_codon:yes gene_type:complete
MKLNNFTNWDTWFLTVLTVTTFGSFVREFPRDGQNWASVSWVYVPEAGSCSVELAVFLHLAQQ